MKITPGDHIEIKLPIKYPIPSQAELKKRFYKLFPHLKMDLDPILHPLAEETERLLCRLLMSIEGESSNTVSIKYNVQNRRLASPKKHGYNCICGFHGISIHFKYCPMCSKKIIWLK